MSKICISLTAFLLLCSCAARQEAYHIDREFGTASRTVFEKQIANPEEQNARTPEGIAGINSERMMAVHNDGFGKPPQETNVFNIKIAK